jgi:hypothetical protein
VARPLADVIAAMDPPTCHRHHPHLVGEELPASAARGPVADVEWATWPRARRRLDVLLSGTTGQQRSSRRWRPAARPVVPHPDAEQAVRVLPTLYLSPAPIYHAAAAVGPDQRLGSTAVVMERFDWSCWPPSSATASPTCSSCPPT